MIGFVFIFIGPIIGTVLILIGLNEYVEAIVAFMPIGMIIGFIPAVVSALTFRFILEKSRSGYGYRIFLAITATVIAGVLAVLFVCAVVLHWPYDHLKENALVGNIHYGDKS